MPRKELRSDMSSLIDFLALSPLENFRCRLPTVALTPNLSIVRTDAIDDEQAVILLGQEAVAAARHMVEATEEGQPETLVQVPFSAGPGEVVLRPASLTSHNLQWRLVENYGGPHVPIDHLNASTHFGYALTALRLLKAGWVGRLPTRVIGDPRASTVQGGIVISCPVEEDSSVWSWFPSPPVYVLEPQDVIDLQHLLRAVSQVSNTNIRIALSRFNRQYSRSQLEDRLIDAVIALESIYLKGIRDELRFRMALRATDHLGGNDADKRQSVFDLVSAAYSMRSGLVHGSTDDIRQIREFKRGEWVTVFEFLEDLTGLVRDALRSILTDIGEKKYASGWHEQLDRAIVRGDDERSGK